MGRSQVRCGLKNDVPQVWLLLFWLFGWVRNPHVLWPDITSPASPVLKNSLHHFHLQSPGEIRALYWLLCHFCNNTGNVAFQFLNKDILESPFSYTEWGVPGHPRIPQKCITVIHQWVYSPCPPAWAYAHILHGFTIWLVLEVQEKDSK